MAFGAHEPPYSPASRAMRERIPTDMAHRRMSSRREGSRKHHPTHHHAERKPCLKINSSTRHTRRTRPTLWLLSRRAPRSIKPHSKRPPRREAPFTNNEALRCRSASLLAVLQLCLTITHQPKDIVWRCENVASAKVTAYNGNDTSSYSRQLSPVTSATLCLEGILPS